MSRPPCVVAVWDLPAETRPRFTKPKGVASLVRRVSDAAGLTQMGVALRTVEPGWAGTNRHFHMVEEEWTYVVSGRGTVRIGPHHLAVSAGSFVGLPPGPRPHHFLAEGSEPLVLLEGGERRPHEECGYYVDLRMRWHERTLEPIVEPLPAEEGEASQCVHVDALPVVDFQHDVEARARRKMRRLNRPTGLMRQAVVWARVEPGAQSTAFHTHDRTDEWVFILAGRAHVRVGNDTFETRAHDFIAHPARGPAHAMEPIEPLTYLMGGQIDHDDVVLYPEAGMQRVGGKLGPIA